MKKVNLEKPLGEASVEELQTLLTQREKEKRDKENALLKEQHDFVLDNVDVLLKLLFPKHGRTSCSDEKPVNGRFFGSYEAPRCSRCQLLLIKSDGYNDSMVLEASLVVRCTQ